jgi:hypothetical protein
MHHPQVVVSLLTISALAAALTLAGGARLEAQTRQFATTPISPTVVGTYLVDHDQLRLLILWRGAAGWFADSGDCRSTMKPTGDSNKKRMFVTLMCGQVALPWSIDFSRNTAMVLQERVNLESESIVLVDGVGTAETAPRIVKRWDIQLTGVQFSYILREAVMSRPELFRELQCDQSVEDAPVQQKLAASCRKLRP